MSIEIERRFLIKNDKWKKFIKSQTFIQQGYLSSKLNGWIVRIRLENKTFKLTLKKHINNFTNYEFEYDIPNNEGETIMSKISTKIIKDRYYLYLNEKNWIVDCFKEDNFPLKIVEIELQNEKENIEIPNFISREISGIKMFTNFQLSKYPFSKWSKKDLQYYTQH